MNPRNPSTTPTSTQVERMREIIIGRQFELLEQRLLRLENLNPQTAARHASNASVEQLEARFEAVRDAMQHQVDQIRIELGGEMVHRKHEVRRLADQIQQAAQAKMTPPATMQEVAATESRLVAWVSSWQKSLEQHLVQRENWLIGQFREELKRVTQPSILSYPAQSPNAAAQEQIAAAAQALSSAAAALAKLSQSFSPQP